MNLGIIFSIGDSFENMAKSGQDELFNKFYVPYFAKSFSKVYIFSYSKEKINNLPNNVEVVPNRLNLHRYFYAIAMPFLNARYFIECDVFRVYHIMGTPPAIMSRIFLGKPYVFNYAYDYKKFAEIEGKRVQKIFIYLLEPFAIFFSSKIFAANRMIFKKLPKSKTIYLPNGVDTNFFKPRKRSRNGQKLTILSVGRLEKQKNFRSLVAALKGLNVKLVIVGAGSMKSELKQIALRYKVNLKIIEKVPNTRMPQVYNRADIFVLPSLMEGSPKVLLEAMASSLPIVGTQVEGIKEIIENRKDGILVKADFKHISYSIDNLLKNRKLGDNLGKLARLKVKSKFNLVKLLNLEIREIVKTCYQ